MTHLEKLVQLQENNQIQNNNNNNNNNYYYYYYYHLNPSLLPQTNSSTINTAIWMWNPNKQQPQNDQEDDSWEVRAFAEDTGHNITWPPRSYSCTFCRREFRSAQALGGHMNVHRRDRARLHGNQLQPNSNSNSSFIIPAHEFVANSTATSTGGLCFVYQLPNPNCSRGGFNPSVSTTLNVCGTSTHQSSSPSTFLSISAFPPTNLISAACSPVMNYPVQSTVPEIDAFRSNNIKAEEATTSGDDDGGEDIDLELRLGHGPTAPT